MQLDATCTVRDIAIEIPSATRVFESLRIDYCCGGNRPLDEACMQTGLDADEVLRLITEAGQKADSTTKPVDLRSDSLGCLTDYIVSKHHEFTKQELERLTLLFVRVCETHGPHHPELMDLRAMFQSLKADLEPHMMKEERILFPFIEQLELSSTQNRPAPFAPFGTVENPIRMMMKEHDVAGDLLREIRKLSDNFSVPEDACLSYRTLFGALEELEADLHQHIHLENNILFPRALEIEQSQEQVTMA